MKQEELNELIVEMISVDLRPISIVEGVGIRKLMTRACPHLETPSRRVITSRIEKLFSQQSEHLKLEIMDAKWVSTTTDGWDSKHNKRTFSTLTVHSLKPEEC